MCRSQFAFSVLSTIIALTSIASRAADAVEMKTMHEKHRQTMNKKAGPVPSLGNPTDELNQLDTRTPVPMPPYMANHQKQNMREHLEAVQGIIAGLAKKDFKAIATAAKRMGFSEEMGNMCEHMGAGAAGFTEQAIQFHKSADEIARFAEKRDQKGVITGLNNTLNRCTTCHSTYRQQIVDEATYKSFAELMKKSISRSAMTTASRSISKSSMPSAACSRPNSNCWPYAALNCRMGYRSMSRLAAVCGNARR